MPTANLALSMSPLPPPLQQQSLNYDTFTSSDVSIPFLRRSWQTLPSSPWPSPPEGPHCLRCHCLPAQLTDDREHFEGRHESWSSLWRCPRHRWRHQYTLTERTTLTIIPSLRHESLSLLKAATVPSKQPISSFQV